MLLELKARNPSGQVPWTWDWDLGIRMVGGSDGVCPGAGTCYGVMLLDWPAWSGGPSGFECWR